MADDVVMVLTSKNLETMAREGGAGNWKTNEDRVRRCRWLVAVRNRHSDWSQGTESHGTAFLIARITGVKPSLEKDRLIIVFDRYAEISKANAWPTAHRNPVAYAKDLTVLGIDPDGLDWQELPNDLHDNLINRSHEEPTQRPLGSAVEEARLLIAHALAIDPAAIKISIQL